MTEDLSQGSVEPHSFMRNNVNPTPFNREQTILFFLRHLNQLPSLYQSQDSIKMTLLYFIISGLDLLGALDRIEDKKSIIEWIYCQQIIPTNDDNYPGQCGFRGFSCAGVQSIADHPDKFSYYGGHIAITYSALCILSILGDTTFSRLNRNSIKKQLKVLQKSDGSYRCNYKGESDVRYIYCAVAIATFINDWSCVDVNSAYNFLMKSQTPSKVFSQEPDLEEHGGSTYCAISALALMGKLDSIGFEDRDISTSSGYIPYDKEKILPLKGESLIDWLVNRHIWGFQGRVNKDSDTCYNWWIGASLQILGYFHLIDEKVLHKFILCCKDRGGFAKDHGLCADLLHTYFSVCGLAFLDEPGISKPHCALGISLRAAREIPHLKVTKMLI